MHQMVYRSFIETISSVNWKYQNWTFFFLFAKSTKENSDKCKVTSDIFFIPRPTKFSGPLHSGELESVHGRQHSGELEGVHGQLHSGEPEGVHTWSTAQWWTRGCIWSTTQWWTTGFSWNLTLEWLQDLQYWAWPWFILNSRNVEIPTQMRFDPQLA